MNPFKFFKRGISPLLKPLIPLLFFSLLKPDFPAEAVQVNREYTIKASLILKFTDFLKWPNENSNKEDPETYHLCLVGKNPFGKIFAQAKEEGILQKNISLRKALPDKSLKGCDIVFLKGRNLKKLKQVLKFSKNYPTVVISESEGFGESGAGINFIKRKNKIRFEINRMALKSQGIKISSYLLNLAIIVGEDSP